MEKLKIVNKPGSSCGCNAILGYATTEEGQFVLMLLAGIPVVARFS